MSQSQRILFIFGTRPEAIKMAPVIRAFREDGGFIVRIAVTAQHRQMLDQVLDFFGIHPDHDLNLMRPDQTLSGVTASCIEALDGVIGAENPDMVFVQGDTTTAFAGSLSAYYRKVPVAHIEAGLRSGDIYAPFPEEINRILTGHIAAIHFAPTARAAENLQLENINRQVHVVGNTVIDALQWGALITKGSAGTALREGFSHLPLSSRFVLITGHRRESFGKPFENICSAISTVAESHPQVHFIYPVHLNPNVREPVNRLLAGKSNIHLIEPLGYPAFIFLLERCHLVLTDSGGLQEEAPSLGKPVLVMREVTERQEGIEAGTARLVGTDRQNIIAALEELLDDEGAYRKMANAVNPYGDGKSSAKILHLTRKYFA